MKLEGIVDYDYRNDILSFKLKDKRYWKSVEYENFVIDIDTDKTIVGLQIFDATTFLALPTANVTKSMLREIKEWIMEAEVTEDRNLVIKVHFSVKQRNAVKEFNPSLTTPIDELLPASTTTGVYKAAT